MRLSTWQKVLYSAGSMACSLSYLAFGTYIQFLYIDILGVKASLIGLGWSVYGVWNAVNDPLAGYLSDNTRTRFGRRRPWLAALCVPLGLFFYLLWVPPSPVLAGGETPLFVYFMAVVLIFDLLWTIVALNWTSLFPEMITDSRERAVVSGWRQLFAVLGLLVGVALPPLMVGADWSGRPGMALLLASVTTLAFAASIFGSRENPAAQAAAQPPFWQAIRATFASRAFRWFLFANLNKEYIYSLLPASVPFWAKYVLRIEGPVQVGGLVLDVGMQNSLLLALAFIMALPALPLWTAVAQWVGAPRGWQISQATFAASMVGLFLAQDFVQGAAATAVLGLSLAGLLVYPDLLIADVIDEDELATGARREGMFFGINGFIIRFAFTLQGLTTGAVLTLSGYVNPAAGNLFPEQPASAVLGIRLLTAGVPILVSLLIIVLLGRYPLQGQRLAELRRRLAAAPPAEALAGG